MELETIFNLQKRSDFRGHLLFQEENDFYPYKFKKVYFCQDLSDEYQRLKFKYDYDFLVITSVEEGATIVKISKASGSFKEFVLEKDKSVFFKKEQFVEIKNKNKKSLVLVFLLIK